MARSTEVTVREAELVESMKIWRFGRSHPEFAISERIRFYEKREVDEWIRNPEDNIVLIAELGNGRLIGFLYCKLMSSHWAVIDNLLVDAKYRKRNVGSRLMRLCEKVLLGRRIEYVSLLAHSSDRVTHHFLEQRGYSPTSQLVWMEKFL